MVKEFPRLHYIPGMHKCFLIISVKDFDRNNHNKCIFASFKMQKIKNKKNNKQSQPFQTVTVSYTKQYTQPKKEKRHIIKYWVQAVWSAVGRAVISISHIDSVTGSSDI